MRRSAAILGTIALTLGVVAGCGSDDKAEPLSQGQLDSSLLTASDLGTGWQQDPSSDSDDSGGVPSCLQDASDTSDDSSGAKAEASFAESGGTILNEQLESHSDDIGKAFDKIKGQLDDCQDLTFTTSGIEFTGSIQPIDDFPKVGDEVAAYTMTLSAQGKTGDFDLAIVRQDQVGMTFIYGGADTPDQSEFSQILTKATDKIGTADSA